MLYNAVVLPMRFVYKLTPSAAWMSLDFAADRILLFDMLMSLFDMVVEDGELRKRKAIKSLFLQEWFYVVLHVTASLDQLWPAVALLFPAHVSLRLLRFLRLPHMLTALLPYADVNRKIGAVAAGQVRVPFD